MRNWTDTLQDILLLVFMSSITAVTVGFAILIFLYIIELV